MHSRISYLDSRYRFGVALVGILVAVLAWWFRFGAPTAGAVRLEVLLAILGFAALGAAYGSRSGRGIGLGAVGLPPLLHFVGSRAASPAALAFLVTSAWVAARRADRAGASDLPEHRGLAVWRIGLPADSWAELVGIRLLAVLAAGVGWRALFSPLAPDVLRSGVAAGGAYFAVIGLAEVVRWSAGERDRDSEGLRRDFAYELAAWCVGVLAVVVFVDSGRSAGIVVLGGVGVLALELARLDRERQVAIEGAAAMREVHLAGHRIIFGESEPLAIARQIFGECRRLIAFSWFQLALLDGNGLEHSWFAGPDAWVREGVPDPPTRPPALPGIHRRVTWKVIERRLEVPGRQLGVIRLWTDPRRQRPGATGWLDSLLPQMASSIHSVLLDREARQDPLTGLADRRALEERLANVHTRSVEGGLPMAVIMADLDRFKRINDLYGHATGDQALMAVAAVLEAHRREKDLCCRYGGEEFAVVLEETDGHTALQVAERLRHAVETLLFKPHGKRIKLRLSAGVAAFPELHIKEPEELLELADEALYKAKHQGRNRCLLALGSGRFESVHGEASDPAEGTGQPDIPTLFA